MTQECTTAAIDTAETVTRTTPLNTRLLVSVKEAAQLLGLTSWSVYKLCESGELKSGRIPGQLDDGTPASRIVIRPEDLRAYAIAVTA